MNYLSDQSRAESSHVRPVFESSYFDYKVIGNRVILHRCFIFNGHLILPVTALYLTQMSEISN